MASKQFGDQLVAVLPRLRRFARGLAGSADGADDLVQAACERALAREHQFQVGTRFDSWMYRIVQTIWIDQLRERTAHKENQIGDPLWERFGSDAPVRQIEAQIELAEVQRAIARLPSHQRAMLLLIAVDGCSQKEAARIVGIPKGTVMSRTARARETLRRTFPKAA